MIPSVFLCVCIRLFISFLLTWKLPTLVCVGYWAVWTNELDYTENSNTGFGFCCSPFWPNFPSLTCPCFHDHNCKIRYKTTQKKYKFLLDMLPTCLFSSTELRGDEGVAGGEM